MGNGIDVSVATKNISFEQAVVAFTNDGWISARGTPERGLEDTLVFKKEGCGWFWIPDYVKNDKNVGFHSHNVHPDIHEIAMSLFRGGLIDELDVMIESNGNGEVWTIVVPVYSIIEDTNEYWVGMSTSCPCGCVDYCLDIRHYLEGHEFYKRIIDNLRIECTDKDERGMTEEERHTLWKFGISPTNLNKKIRPPTQHQKM